MLDRTAEDNITKPPGAVEELGAERIDDEREDAANELPEAEDQGDNLVLE